MFKTRSGEMLEAQLRDTLRGFDATLPRSTAMRPVTQPALFRVGSSRRSGRDGGRENVESSQIAQS